MCNDYRKNTSGIACSRHWRDAGKVKGSFTYERPCMKEKDNWKERLREDNKQRFLETQMTLVYSDWKMLVYSN